MTTETKPFEGWAIIELLGHKVIAGYATEQTIAGAAFIRVDVPEIAADAGRPASTPFTKFFGPTAIYGITPTDENTARLAVASLQMRPLHSWHMAEMNQEARRLPAPHDDGADDGAHDDDFDPEY